MTKRGRKPARATSAKSVAFTPALVTWDFLPAAATVDYARRVGDGLNSSVIVPVLNWVMRAFPQAPCVIERRAKDDAGFWEVQHGHPAEQMLEQPNPYYDGTVLWMATAMDFCFGEAFWLKVRDGMGELRELWWVPRGLMEPKWDSAHPEVFIDHYDYHVGGTTKPVPVDDVVHFRFGMDPKNPRRGFSQLAATLREVYTDDQASQFTAAILKNMGVIGVVFSPETGGPPIPPPKLTEFKNYIQSEFTGDKRGRALAFSSPTKAQVLAYNLQGFDMGPIRDISEERVCAAIGVPAAVIGFGTGLQQTKVGATMREMRQQAWTDCLMPTQKIIARQLKASYLSEFQENTNLFRVRFDVSKIPVLWEDELQKAQRIATEAEKSLITVAEARRELGLPADAKHEFYLRQVTVQAVPADDPMRQVARVTETPPPGTPPPPTEPVTPPPAGEGTGGSGDEAV